MMEKTGRLGFGGWLKFLFRTVLYSVLLFIIASVAMVSSENPSVKDGFPTISFLIPFVAGIAAWMDRNR